jgi:hypothetical protein
MEEGPRIRSRPSRRRRPHADDAEHAVLPNPGRETWMSTMRASTPWRLAPVLRAKEITPP